MSALAQDFLSELAAKPSATNLWSLTDHSNIRNGSSVQLPIARRWSCEASAWPSLTHSPPASSDDQSTRDLPSENKKCKNMKFLMDHKDHRAPEPAHASEFSAQTYFLWLAEASTSREKTLLDKWCRERKTLRNCLQSALLRQYGFEFQFTVNKQPISERVSSFNVMSPNQHRLCSGNQKTLLHSWERRLLSCFTNSFY